MLDTCGSNSSAACFADEAEQVAAYQESMLQLTQQVLPQGDFCWQLMLEPVNCLTSGYSSSPYCVLC